MKQTTKYKFLLIIILVVAWGFYIWMPREPPILEQYDFDKAISMTVYDHGFSHLPQSVDDTGHAIESEPNGAVKRTNREDVAHAELDVELFKRLIPQLIYEKGGLLNARNHGAWYFTVVDFSDDKRLELWVDVAMYGEFRSRDRRGLYRFLGDHYDSVDDAYDEWQRHCNKVYRQLRRLRYREDSTPRKIPANVLS